MRRLLDLARRLGNWYPIRLAWRGWMLFAEALGWVMSRVVLTVLFVVLFVPTRVGLSLLRKDLLGLRWLPDAPSYWTERPAKPFEPRQCERQW